MCGCPASSEATDSLVAAFLAGATVAFLLLFRSTELSGNSVDYALRVGEGANLFYPPHLLHVPVVFLLYRALAPAFGIGPVLAGQIHTILWAAVTTVSVFMVLRRRLNAPVTGVLAALILLVSHGFWVYATQIEVYVPVVGCLSGLTAVLFASGDHRHLGGFRLLACALLWALSTLYHQANVMLLLPLAAYFLVGRGRKGLMPLAVLSVVAGTISLATYVAAYWITQPGEPPIRWMLSITHAPMTNWGQFTNFSLKGVTEAIGAQIYTFAILPETIADRQRPLMVIVLVAMVAVLGWNGYQVLRGARLTRERLYLILWFGSYFGFFVWWITDVYKFYILSLIPLVLLAAFAIDDLLAAPPVSPTGRRAASAAAVVVILVLFWFNSASVRELQQSLGPDYFEAVAIDELAPPGCAVYADEHITETYALYLGRKRPLYGAQVPVESYYSRLHGGSLHADYSPLADSCLVIRLGYLSRPFFGDTWAPYMEPGEWPRFLAWFFDVRPAEDGGITYSSYTIFEKDGGPPHALIDRSRRVRSDDLHSLIAAIAAAQEQAAAKFGRETWRIPASSHRVARSRYFVFGYHTGDFVEQRQHPSVPAGAAIPR